MGVSLFFYDDDVEGFQGFASQQKGRQKTDY